MILDHPNIFGRVPVWFETGPIDTEHEWRHPLLDMPTTYVYSTLSVFRYFVHFLFAVFAVIFLVTN